MRVCLISSSFYPAIFYGGPISATWDLSKKIGEKGVEIYVSTTNANGNKRLENVDVKNHTKQAENVFVRYYHEQIINLFSLSFLLNIYSDIKKSDVVYVQYLFHYTVAISLLFSWILGKKIVLCPRGSFSNFTLTTDKSFWKKLWISIFIKPYFTKINWQASSYLEKEDILKYFPNSKVYIISDGIDFDSFQNSQKVDIKSLVKKYTNKEFKEVSDVIFSMGRLHKIKGFDVLIDSFSMYVKENPFSKLLIAGVDDGMENKLLNQIDSLGLIDSVFLIGLVDFKQKKELLSNSSVFALCSEFESFGIVIAEALACGIPIIVSNKTAWRDLNKNNCGIFAENQKEDFFRALNQIKLSDLSSEDCKKYVKDNFDWEVVSEKFLNLITKK